MILDPFPARIMRALDGDSLEVAPHDAPHRPLRIRIAWLDTPEPGYFWCREAKWQIQEFCGNADCMIFPVAFRGRVEDRWGRIVAQVFAHEEDLTAFMLAEGGGKYWTLHGPAPDDQLYRRLEAMAREDTRGVWRGPRVPR